MKPASSLAIPASLDLLLSMYRIFEWVLALVLFLSLYTRTAAEQATRMIVDLIGYACWIWIAMVWTLLPLIPSQVYSFTEDGGAYARLGGQLIHPAYLAMLTSIGFFYALFFFPTALWRWVCCFVAILTLILTHSRSEQIGFLVALSLYSLLFAGSSVLKWITIMLGLLSASALVAFEGLFIAYFTRGQSIRNLATLDDRTLVWQAALRAFSARPIIGYGFIVGARDALRDQWSYMGYAHWVPPQAHNEFIQALIVGGILCLTVVLAVYGRLMWGGICVVRCGLSHVFLFLVSIQLTLKSIAGPTITMEYGRVGAIFLLCYIGLIGAANRRSGYRAQPRKQLSNAVSAVTSTIHGDVVVSRTKATI